MTTGRLLSMATGPSHVMMRTSPRSAGESEAKWYMTKTIRYPMDTSATTLVYFNESNLLKNAKGMMASMKAVTQKCRSTRKGISSALLSNPRMTPGIRSPIIIRYDTPTPKHLIAMAASNTTAAFGYVICESAKKDDDP